MKGRNILFALLGIGSLVVISMSMGNYVHAEDYEGRPVTGMDEEGNVYEIEPEVGIVDEALLESEIMTFTEEDMIVNFNTKGNVVTEYKELYTGADGYTNGAFGADAAYLGMENGRVKFMLSGVVGTVASSEVQVLKTSSANSISHYTVANGWLIHRVSYDLNSSNYMASIKCGKAPSYLSVNGVYYSYDGHYFYTDYSVMLQDYRSEIRDHALNAGQPYYNYFQYLPMRSLTRYTGEELSGMIDDFIDSYGYENSKMTGIGSCMESNQNTYGVNALLMAGIAANESGWGSSQICRDKNNLFGLNAVDSSPYTSAGTFLSAEACVSDFAQIWMSKGYLNPDDWRYFGGFLGNKASGLNVKFGSDPYWGEKAASIAWLLDEKGGGYDQYAYTIGIKDLLPTSHGNRYMRADSHSNSAIMYYSGQQSNSAFIILNDTPQNSFYQVQSDALLNEQRTGIDVSTGYYDYDSMYAYIGADYLTVVNTGNMETGVDAFRDVTEESWYYEYVKYVYEHGIMTGLNKRTFGPGEDLARAQFATITYRLAGTPAVSYAAVFPDVADNTFYTSAVIWANANGIITGYSDNGYFGPSDNITREQMATIMYRYAKFCGYDTTQRADLGTFPDAGNVQSFAAEAMQWAVGTGLIQGDQGRLNPQGTAVRAQCATIITRFMKLYAE